MDGLSVFFFQNAKKQELDSKRTDSAHGPKRRRSGNISSVSPAIHVSVMVTNAEITEDEFGIVFSLHYLCSNKIHIII